ncbi:MAG: FTR1 family protein [Thermoplasmata archaeon]|nr:FTR1 family protein [Candidatus Thermoplasmatota archaeon]MCK4949755.1 FTR1 family protein [Thermoplasmata archaeon]
MIAQFLLVLREGLEAALIVGIVFAYLRRIGKGPLTRFLTLGAASAIGVSILAALLIFMLVGQLSDPQMEIFEGVASLLAVGVLTIMIFWMSKKGPELKREIESKLDSRVSRGEVFAVFGISFVAVVREGLETVLFLFPLALSDSAATILGLVAGLAVVLLLLVLLMKGIERLDIKKFFTVTGVLLIVFAAGLTATAVHEFNEAGVVPPVVNEVWNINPPRNPDGSYPVLHEKGAIGGIMKSLLGYNGNPSLTEVTAYVSYWIVISGYLFLTNAETVKSMLRAMGAKVRSPLRKGRMAAVPSEDIRLDEATARGSVER